MSYTEEALRGAKTVPTNPTVGMKLHSCLEQLSSCENTVLDLHRALLGDLPPNMPQEVHSSSTIDSSVDQLSARLSGLANRLQQIFNRI